MPWESIGSVGSGDDTSEDWIQCCADLAITYLKFTCGAPPAGSSLGLMWQDHELGDYPTIGVYSEFEPPWEYISDCEIALEKFDDAVDWSVLASNDEEDEDQEPDSEEAEPET